MKIFGDILKVAAGVLAALWASLTPLIQVLLVMMAIDIATGFLSGYVNKRLNSDVSFVGMAKKVMVLLITLAAFWVERAVGAEVPIAEVVAGFYIAHEGLSILENAGEAGLPIPKILRAALSKLNGNENE